jgi:hypothetical protein
VPDGLDPLDPVDASWRLALRCPVPDDELEAAVFETICMHEHAHLVDSFHYLPPARHLGRVLGLLFGRRLDPFRVEGHLEGRAETAAVAFSAHTDILLAHVADFLVDADATARSPHALGFRRLAERLVAGLAEDPETAAFAPVRKWHLAPPEAFRRVAARIVRSYW